MDKWKELASAPFPYDTTRYHVLRVENQGPRIRAFVDGKQVLEASDSEILKGKAGIAANPGGGLNGGWGWAIPLAPLTLIATVGGIVDRAVVREGQIVARPMLPLPLSFDHAVIDGAPAARFTETLRTVVETAAAFEPPAASPDG